jgi:glycosyltransferase involved in cell wall biosynthesis
MDAIEAPVRRVLKVALYQPWLYLHGGLERTVLELVTGSRHDWTIFSGHYDPKGTFPEFAQLNVKPLRKLSIDRRMINVLTSAVRIAIQKLPLTPGTDAVVICCDGLGDMLTFRNHSVPVFNLCFTPLRAAFDPWYESEAIRHRNWLQRFAYSAFKLAFRLVDRRAWRHYSGVVAISAEVKARILAAELCDSDRMVIAHPGVRWSPNFPDVQYDPIILVSGRIMWTKNIELAIRAFQHAKIAPAWSLVIAGYVDHKSASYLAMLRELAGDCSSIRFVVSPSDTEMQEQFKRASICVFTPLNEDWGIVPLEAMAHAKLVLAVDRGGPRETVVNGETGYLLPPDALQWGDRIAALAADPALVRQLGRQAHQHAKRFTWAKFVSDVDDALDAWLQPHAIALTRG